MLALHTASRNSPAGPQASEEASTPARRPSTDIGKTIMAHISFDHPTASLPLFGALRARLSAATQAFKTWRRKREVYLRTLRELQSYRPHELHDLRIQTGDFEALARQQAGW